MNCVFCRIVDGEIPCVKLYENDRAISFMDINPLTRGHLLVIPKKHFENILDVDENTYSVLAATIHRMSKAVRRALNPDGMNVLQLNGEAANQVVPHLHMHLIPRWYGDGILTSKWEPVPGDIKAIQETADRIRERLA